MDGQIDRRMIALMMPVLLMGRDVIIITLQYKNCAIVIVDSEITLAIQIYLYGRHTCDWRHQQVARSAGEHSVIDDRESCRRSIR